MLKAIFDNDGNCLNLSEDPKIHSLITGAWEDVTGRPNVGSIPSKAGDGTITWSTPSTISHIDSAKIKLISKLHKHRDNLFFTNFVYNSNTFEGDAEAIESFKEAIETNNTINIANLQGGSITPFSVDWRDVNGVVVTLGSADFTAINLLLATKKTNLWTAAATKEVAIKALTTLSSVNSYDITTGWPS